MNTVLAHFHDYLFHQISGLLQSCLLSSASVYASDECIFFTASNKLLDPAIQIFIRDSSDATTSDRQTHLYLAWSVTFLHLTDIFILSLYSM